MENAPAPRSCRGVGLFTETCSHDGENDDEGEERERLNEGEAERKQQQDACTSSGIAGHSLSCRGSRAALTEAAEARSNAHAYAGSDGYESCAC